MKISKNIEEKITMEMVLNKYNISTKDGNIECIYNSDHKNMKINKNYFSCTDCKKSGNIITFVSKIKNIGFEDSIRKINEDFNLNLDLTELTKLGIFEYNNSYLIRREDNKKESYITKPLTNFIIEMKSELKISDNSETHAIIKTNDNKKFKIYFTPKNLTSKNNFKASIKQFHSNLSFYGSDNELEFLINYIYKQKYDIIDGAKHEGIIKNNEQYLYVSEKSDLNKNNEKENKMLTLKAYKGIETTLLDKDIISDDELNSILNSLFEWNIDKKVLPTIGFVFSCFIKSHLSELKYKFPHLILNGERGGGKSCVCEDIINEIFSVTVATNASNISPFSFNKYLSSNNCVPFILEEYKPYSLNESILKLISNTMRSLYDGFVVRKGRQDLSVHEYKLIAPLIVVGEASINEPAIKERIIDILFTKTTHTKQGKYVMDSLKKQSKVLQKLGKTMLLESLSINLDDLQKEYDITYEKYEKYDLPSRVHNNITCITLGIVQLLKLCKKRNIKNPINKSLDEIIKIIAESQIEYLLDDGNNTKTAIDNTIDILDRMILLENSDYKFINNNTELALNINNFYDRYTKYIKDHGIKTEHLELKEFIKQLKQSKYYITYKPVKFDKAKKSHVLNYKILLEFTDLNNIVPSSNIEIDF